MSGAPAPDIKMLEGTKPVINDPDVVTAVAECAEGGIRRQVQDFAAGHRQRGFFRIRRRRRAVDDVQIGVYDQERVDAARNGGPPIPAKHSPLFAPVPKPTIETGVTAMTLAVLGVSSRRPGGNERVDLPDLILRRREAPSRRDEWHQPGRMVRDGAKAPPHHEGRAVRLPTRRKIAPLPPALVQALPSRLHCRPTSLSARPQTDESAQMGGNNP